MRQRSCGRCTMGRSVPRRAKRLNSLSPPRGFRLPKPGCSRRLHCETLEDRRLLAITVDTLLDELDGSTVDGDISLRDAIAATTAGETIDFAMSLDGGTVLLTLGELAINRPLTIDATALTG